VRQDLLIACGLLIGPAYILLYLVGGALRPRYSQIANSVSELLSPGAPRKRALTTIQAAYAVLHILMGLGVLLAVRGGGALTLGRAGAWTIVAIGVATLGTAIFPQDAEGTEATAAGTIHKALVFGVLVPASALSTLLLGWWSRSVPHLQGFDIYSFATVGGIVVMGAVGGAAVKTQYAGLAERIAALVTHQWLFVLAMRLLLS
jgi:hypothetical protein